MASQYNPDEQEQIEQIKGFWARYGTLVTALLLAVLLAVAGTLGWNQWQRQQAAQAALLYQALDEAVAANDLERVRRVWADTRQQAGRTLQAQHAGLLAARALQQAQASDEARAALQFVLERGRDPALLSVARLRLAALELEAGQYAAALQSLSSGIAPEFAALAADRRGDILLAQGQTDAARAAYLEAWSGLSAELDYRRIVEAKLNALGLDPTASRASPANPAPERTP